MEPKDQKFVSKAKDRLSRENDLRLWATVAPSPPFRPRDSLGSEEVLCKELVYR